MYNLEVKSKLTFQQRQAVDELILAVWTHEQKATSDVEVIAEDHPPIQDPLDKNAVHVLVTDDKALVGYGRLSLFLTEDDLLSAPAEVPYDTIRNKCGYISRLVVHPSARGRGISTLIDETRISIARAYGVQQILGCAVGAVRQGSLAKVGFEKSRAIESFDNPWYRTTRPVRLMVMDLSSSTMSSNVQAF